MYVNVRRYLIYLEHSIDNSTQWAVFENNGPLLWARVKDSIDSFLNSEFVEGRLLGTSPATSYFIRCDRTTMTQNDLDNGRMICLIGVSVLETGRVRHLPDRPVDGQRSQLVRRSELER